MTSRRFTFTRPWQPQGRLVRSRFALRREPETKTSPAQQQPNVIEQPYAHPGRGPNGESSN